MCNVTPNSFKGGPLEKFISDSRRGEENTKKIMQGKVGKKKIMQIRSEGKKNPAEGITPSG